MYKTILVYVDQTDRAVQRIDLAARLALQNDAHLVGTAMTGMPAFLLPAVGFDPAFAAVPYAIEQLRAEADRALDVFESMARHAGVASFERRRVDEEAGWGVSRQARYCDLVVIGQTPPDKFAPRLRSDFPEYVLVNSARPVLVVPAGGIQGEFGKRVTIAWNGNGDSVRAIASAIPLLQRADEVNVVIFDADKFGDLQGEDPGADIANYLARHGIGVEVTSTSAGEDTGEALLCQAADHNADLIVMGAYGHSRFREILLGGVTRTALRTSALPLWMAH
jgi:nucleotide-binding universal stress UspA family protein